MPTQPGWRYNPGDHSYRDSRGRYISRQEMVRLRNEFADALRGETDRLAQRLTNREITVQQWLTDMRRLVKDAFVAQYAAGRGGVQNMGPADYGRIGAMLSSQNRGQYWYLQRFAEDIAAGRLTPGMIQARAGLYMSASVQAFERGRAASYGLPRLPALPGDGSTACLVNCRCSWVIEEDAIAWRATWTLGNAEHCPDCLSRAAMWAPFVVLKAEGLAAMVGGPAGLLDAMRWLRWQAS